MAADRQRGRPRASPPLSPPGVSVLPSAISLPHFLHLSDTTGTRGVESNESNANGPSPGFFIATPPTDGERKRVTVRQRLHLPHDVEQRRVMRTARCCSHPRPAVQG